jgi:hypothetical protein
VDIMPRFKFHANSLAVSGRITRPFDQTIDPMAKCDLPEAGGQTSAVAPAYKLTIPGTGTTVLAFDSAETLIRGEEAPAGTFSTVVDTSLKNLNVLDVLRAAEVNFHLALRFDTAIGRPTIDSAGSRFVGLTLNGQPFDVQVDDSMSRQAADYQNFKKTHPHLKEKDGKIPYSLGRNPQLKFNDPDFGYYHVPGFGRIYFAEWVAAPDTQSLTMFRIELGSPVGGTVTVCGGTGNGVPT